MNQCPNCGNEVPASQEFCDDECESEYLHTDDTPDDNDPYHGIDESATEMDGEESEDDDDEDDGW